MPDPTVFPVPGHPDRYLRRVPRYDDHQNEKGFDPSRRAAGYARGGLVPSDDVTTYGADADARKPPPVQLSIEWPECGDEFRANFPEVAAWVDSITAFVHPEDEDEGRRRRAIVMGAGVEALHLIQDRMKALGPVDGAPGAAVPAWGIFGALALLQALVIGNTWATHGHDPQLPTKMGSAAMLMAFPIEEQLLVRSLPRRHTPPTGPFHPSPENGGPQDRH